MKFNNQINEKVKHHLKKKQSVKQKQLLFLFVVVIKCENARTWQVIWLIKEWC